MKHYIMSEPNNYKNANKTSTYMALVIGAFALVPNIAFAADVDISKILFNLREQVIQPFTEVIFMLCYVCGIYFGFRGLGFLRQFGIPLSQMSRPGEIAGPMMYLFVGALLIFIPLTADIGSQSLFGDSQADIFKGNVDFGKAGKASEQLVGYLPQGIEQKWADVINTLVLFIEFIGFIAFVRGLFIMAKSGNPGVQPGAVSKGIVHLIGGIIAINFIPAAKIVHNSLFK